MLFEYQLLVIMHKCSHSPALLPPSLTDLFRSHSSFHSYNTRNKDDLHLSIHSTSFGQRCYSYCMSKFWNILPLPLKLERSLPTFKCSLKTHFYTNKF